MTDTDTQALGHKPRPQKRKRNRRRPANTDGLRSPLAVLRFLGKSRRRP